LRRGGHLHGRCDLRVRSSKKTRNLIGQRLVGSQPGKLVLPEVEIAPGKPIEITRVVFGGHVPSIAHRHDNAPLACANRALSHCGIGAKVAHPM
jgi:hypothetical protein